MRNVFVAVVVVESHVLIGSRTSARTALVHTAFLIRILPWPSIMYCQISAFQRLTPLRGRDIPWIRTRVRKCEYGSMRTKYENRRLRTGETEAIRRLSVASAALRDFSGFASVMTLG